MIALFLVLLAVSGLVDVLLGLWAVAGWESFAGVFDLGTATGDGLRMMGTLLGLVLLFFAYLQISALLWIRRQKEEGYRVALAFAGFLIVSSAAIGLGFGRMEFLLIDGSRGVLLAVFGFLALRSPLTVRRLGIPAQARGSEARRPQEHHRRDDRDRGRSSRFRGSSQGRGSEHRRSDRRGGAATEEEGAGSGDRRGSRRRPPRGRSQGRPGDDPASAAPRQERRPLTDEQTPRPLAARPNGVETRDDRQGARDREPRGERSSRRPGRRGQGNGRRRPDGPSETRREPREDAPPSLPLAIREQAPPADNGGGDERPAGAPPMGPVESTDVVNALGAFAPKPLTEFAGSSEEDMRRRKKGQRQGASFRPRERRTRRPLG